MTEEEMRRAKIPLHLRDYCAHLLPTLHNCIRDNKFSPSACKMERMAYDKCQYDEYLLF